MNLPWKAGEPLSADNGRLVRRRAIFQYHKWDQQVGDVSTFCLYPLLLDRSTWSEISSWAELLSAEILAVEQELAARPELHGELGLPPSIIRLLRRGQPASRGLARLIRFDFHFTTGGWRISEANTDVPGAWNEATGYPELLAPFYPGLQPLPGMADDYVRALTKDLSPGSHLALVHATAYTEDRQGMVFLAEKLKARGFQPVLISPEQLEWNAGRARIRTAWCREQAGAIVRYYPAEWLVNLPGSSWHSLFQGSLTPLSNPATALLIQSKRLPLIWDKLRTSLPAWRRFLPPCADPCQVDWENDPEWMVKPALGRIGHDIGLRDCLSTPQWDKLRRQVRRSPKNWVAQRRFRILPLPGPDGEVFPCFGVYTIDGKVAGAYGRVGSTPLINSQAKDIALFLTP